MQKKPKKNCSSRADLFVCLCVFVCVTIFYLIIRPSPFTGPVNSSKYNATKKGAVYACTSHLDNLIFGKNNERR